MKAILLVILFSLGLAQAREIGPGLKDGVQRHGGETYWASRNPKNLICLYSQDDTPVPRPEHREKCPGLDDYGDEDRTKVALGDPDAGMGACFRKCMVDPGDYGCGPLYNEKVACCNKSCTKLNPELF